MRTKLKVIKSRRAYREAMKAIEKLFDAEPGTEEHDALEVLALLVDDYERRTFPMEALIPRTV